MRFWKKGLALLAAFALMMGGAACQKRTLEIRRVYMDDPIFLRSMGQQTTAGKRNRKKLKIKLKAGMTPIM